MIFSSAEPGPVLSPSSIPFNKAHNSESLEMLLFMRPLLASPPLKTFLCKKNLNE